MWVCKACGKENRNDRVRCWNCPAPKDETAVMDEHPPSPFRTHVRQPPAPQCPDNRVRVQTFSLAAGTFNTYHALTNTYHALPKHALPKFEAVEFANPKLKSLAAQVKIYHSQNFFRSITLELEAWFPICCHVFTLLMPFWLGVPVLFLFLIIPVSLRFIFVDSQNFFRLRRLAERHRIDPLATLHNDSRDPILYLRPFYADFTSDPTRRTGKTDEELLTFLFQGVGPVIAVGDPGESRDPDKSLPIIGASRIYFDEANWRNNVERLISISQLVVIHPGTTEGLLWEIGTVTRQMLPSNLFVSFLSWQLLDEMKRQVRYEHFKEAAETVLNKSQSGRNIRLPELIGNAIFLTFNDYWVPRLIKANEWTLPRT